MRGAQLKNYESYIKSIRLYCKAIQLKIQFSDLDGEGSYLPGRRIIRVDPSLSESATIAVLLHELGHMLDDSLMNKSTYTRINIAYGNLEGPKYQRYKKTIVRTETRAWEYGRSIALILGIRLGKWYDKVRHECLKGYRK